MPTIRSRWPAILWIVAILAVSSVPGPALSKVGFSVQDKLAHLFEYGVLGSLLALRSMALGRSRTQAFLRTVAWAVVLGAADETYQRFTPGRDCSVADWMADVAGAALAAGFVILGWHGWRARRGDARLLDPDEEEA